MFLGSEENNDRSTRNKPIKFKLSSGDSDSENNLDDWSRHLCINDNSIIHDYFSEPDSDSEYWRSHGLKIPAIS